MTKNKKIFTILVVFILILFAMSNIVSASLVDVFKSEISVSGTGAKDLKSTGGKIVGIIQVTGTIISIGMLIILGIKYVLGSVEEKAEYKKSMLPYLIGSILIFGFSTLTQIIYEWASRI